LARKQNGTAAQNEQTGTNRHKMSQFLCRHKFWVGLTFDGDGIAAELWQSFSHQKRGLATDGEKNRRDCGTKRHKT
jgi:hypothetical protein